MHIGIIGAGPCWGFEAIGAGALDGARLLEPFALLWIQLAYGHQQGRKFAFGLLRRD
jgi:predicted dinucleotide-binding enzyme